jgi:endo-1,4-beta-xylanase
MIPRTVFLMAALAAALPAQFPTPHAGWKLVPGGENLIQTGYWGSVQFWYPSGSAGATLTVSNGTLNAFSAGSNYFGFEDPVGPWLSATGDFGVTAVLQTGPNTDGVVTLTGSIATTTNYWQGRQYLEFGVDPSGDYIFAYWNGTSSNVTDYQTLKQGSGQPATGQVTMELLRESGQFYLYFNGAQYGPFADPGLFPTGLVMPGFQADPGQTAELSLVGFEVPQSDTTSQMIARVGNVPYTQSPPTLGSAAAAAGKIFGVQVDATELAMGIYNAYTAETSGQPNMPLEAQVIGQFGELGNYGLYSGLAQPTQGEFQLDEDDALAATARATGRWPMFCHLLIGGANSYEAPWIVNGGFSAAELTQIMQTEIQTIMTRYKGVCSSYTVVNEAMTSTGTLRTDNIWAQTIGPNWVDMAFQFARQADPTAKLFLTDYGIENAGAKATGFYNYVAGMQQRGIPIDGVAFECHWVPESTTSPYSPNVSQMVANMAQFAALGLIVRETELDVALNLPAGASDLALQATTFANSVQACLMSPNCIGVNVFGVDDAISWINGAFPGEGQATMFDNNFNQKPAYTAVMNTLTAAPQAKSTIFSVHAASGGTTIAQNTFIEIRGFNLVPPTTPAAGVIWNTAPDFAEGKMPTNLQGVTATVNGNPAFIYYYCSAQTSTICALDQVNVLTPLDNTVGSVQVIVTANGVSSAPFTVTMAAAAPTFLLFNLTGPIVATHLNYSLAGGPTLYPGASTPAKPGEQVVLYGVGFGLPTTPIVNGSSTQSGAMPSTPSCTVAGPARRQPLRWSRRDCIK